MFKNKLKLKVFNKIKEPHKIDLDQCWVDIKKNLKIEQSLNPILTLNFAKYHPWWYSIQNLPHMFSLNWELVTWKLAFGNKNKTLIFYCGINE